MVFDVVVVGAAGVDTLVRLPDPRPDLARDSTMVSVLDTVGQAGAFTARGFARLGWRTGFIGVLGDDWAGEAVRSAFARDGVELAAVVRDPQGTARSVNLMGEAGRRWAFYDGRGHMDLEPPDASAFGGARLALFHLSDWSRHLLAPAAAAGCVIATDLQDVADLDDPYRADFLAAADVVFCSAAHLDDPAGAARELLARRPRVVVIGMGVEGALGASRAGLVRLPPPTLPPTAELPLIDTNGAGDALAVGVLARLVLSASEGVETSTEDMAAALVDGQLAARWTCAWQGSDDLITAPDLARLRLLAAPDQR